MKLTRAEQETIITFNEADSTAEVFTYNSRMQRTLARLAGTRPGEVTHIKTSPEGGTTYTTPKGWVKIKPPRVQSEAQRAVSMRAMQKAHLSRESTRHGDD